MQSSKLAKIKTDVLILGGGAAGIRAASRAAAENVDVTLVNNGDLFVSGSTFNPLSPNLGFQALLADEQSEKNISDFFDEIISIGLGQAQPALVEILITESQERIKDLIQSGIKFKTQADGSYLRLKGCFSNIPRALITEDPNMVVSGFRNMLAKHPVRTYQGEALRLVCDQGECWGALVQNSKNQLVLIQSKSTVLAIGGCGSLFKHHFTGPKALGTGYALAYNAGARLANLEFIQLMLGVYSSANKQFLSINQFAKNIFNPSYSTLYQMLRAVFGSDDQIQKAFQNRQTHFPFSTRHLDYKIDLAIARHTEKNDTQINSSDNPIYHFAHASNGGVQINSNAETSVTGLYAAGEVATGMHGADRIGGGMMTATQVFGYRAGRFAALRSKQVQAVPNVKPNNLLLGSTNTADVIEMKRLKNDLKKDIQNLMHQFMGIIRTRRGLRNCHSQLLDRHNQVIQLQRSDKVDLASFYQMENMIQAAQLMAEFAIKRSLSMGPHNRLETRLKN